MQRKTDHQLRKKQNKKKMNYIRSTYDVTTLWDNDYISLLKCYLAWWITTTYFTTWNIYLLLLNLKLRLLHFYCYIGSLGTGYQLIYIPSYLVWKIIYPILLPSWIYFWLVTITSPVQCGSFYLIKQLFYSRLLDTRFVIANATLRTSLAIYHPISDIYSRNNF